MVTWGNGKLDNCVGFFIVLINMVCIRRRRDRMGVCELCMVTRYDVG